MKQIRRYLCLLVLSALLSACASTSAPDDTLFLLQQGNTTTETQTQQAPADATATVLTLAPVQLASYLAGKGIVYQTGPNRIVVAGNNRWAAPLQGQLSDGLYQTLDEALAGVDVRRPGMEPAGRDVGFKLVVHVQQFQGRYDGNAIISGNWRLFHDDGEIAGRGAFDTTIPLKKDGYAALVRALSHGWQGVRQDIGADVGQALRAGRNGS